MFQIFFHTLSVLEKVLLCFMANLIGPFKIATGCNKCSITDIETHQAVGPFLLVYFFALIKLNGKH